MNGPDQIEGLVVSWFRAEAGGRATYLDEVLAVTRGMHQRSSRSLGLVASPMLRTLGPRAWLAVGVVVAVVGVSFGTWWQASTGRVPPIETPSPQPTGPIASPSGAVACYSQSSPAGVRPSNAPGPIPTWSAAHRFADWPGPLRLEPDGPPVDMAEPPFVQQRFEDTAKEPYLEGLGYIDIVAVSGSKWIAFQLAAEPSTIPDPNERWLAYGVVLDADVDGVPDYRVGMDNAMGTDSHREWVTDLVAGTTDSHGPPFGGPFSGPVQPDTYYAGEGEYEDFTLPSPSINFAFHCPSTELRYYAWASVIEDGRIVTDFAPDAGWLRFGPVGFGGGSLEQMPEERDNSDLP